MKNEEFAHLKYLNVEESPFASRHSQLMCSEHKLPHQRTAHRQNHHPRVHRRVAQEILQHVILLIRVIPSIAQKVISVKFFEKLQYAFLLQSVLKIFAHCQRKEIRTVNKKSDILEAKLVEDARKN